MNDQDILTLLFARNEDALSEISQKYTSYCKAISSRILPDPQDAEECVNETWLVAWNTIPPQRPARLGIYLGRITRNLSISRLRRNQSAKRGAGVLPLALEELEDALASSSLTEQIVEEHLLTESINRFLRRCGTTERNIFLRRYWYLFSIREIASEYHFSESKIKSILFRTRKKLTQHLKKEEIL